jgi:hypothetical protein
MNFGSRQAIVKPLGPGNRPYRASPCPLYPRHRRERRAFFCVEGEPQCASQALFLIDLSRPVPQRGEGGLHPRAERSWPGLEEEGTQSPREKWQDGTEISG